MAIPVSAQFNYTVIVQQSPDGSWHGQAEDSSAQYHPGLAGNCPRITVADGWLRLHPSEWLVAALTKPHYREWGPPRSATMPVGHVERMLRDSDRLMVSRGGTTDLALTITRDGRPIAGFGAVTGEFTPSVLIENDPRVYEEDLYHLQRTLEEPGTALLWIDATDPASQDTTRRRTTLSGVKTLVVAIAGGTEEERRQLNNRIALEGRPGGPGTYYVDVGARVTNEREWREYLNGLPSSRPLNVFVRFVIDGVATQLREAQYEVRSPWQLYVHKVFRLGLPGEWSHVGIVHEGLELGRTEVIETVEAIASREIKISVP